MIRSLLVGVLAVSSLAACTGETSAPAVKPGVAAGKVLEVSGTVTATRGGTTRDLVAGDEVAGDDTIKTGADGRVAIVLEHNHARWELGASKTAVVSASLAWTAARQAGAGGASDEATLAAGRHAEKAGADTGATARASEAPPAPPASPASTVPPRAEPAEGAHQAGPGGAAADADRAVKEERAKAPERAAVAPSPRRALATAPDDEAKRSKGDSGGLGLSGSGPGGGGAGTSTNSLGTIGTIGTIGHGAGASRGTAANDGAPRGGAPTPVVAPTTQAPPAPPPPPPSPAPLVVPTPATIRAAILRERAAISSCLGDQASLSVQVVVTAGALQFVLADGAPAALPGCLRAIEARLRFDPTTAPVTTPFTLTK